MVSPASKFQYPYDPPARLVVSYVASWAASLRDSALIVPVRMQHEDRTVLSSRSRRGTKAWFTGTSRYSQWSAERERFTTIDGGYI